MFERLIKLVRQEKVSLFIGAGFSKEACAPSLHDLKKIILGELDDEQQKKNHENDSLDALTNYFVKDVCCGSRNQLISILHKAFEFTPKSMEDHELLSRIPHFRNIFTTNYDTLLESSYRNEDRKVVRNDNDCAYIEKPYTIFKIHGDFTAPDSVVITSDDYSKFFTENKNPLMWNMVKSEFTEKHILFIGYSLEDDNILNIIKEVSDALHQNQKDMFLIAPNISDQKQTELKKLKVNYFNSIANSFLTQLTKVLEKHISDDFKKKLITGETYSRFWDYHNAIPTVTTPLKGNNIIDNIKPLPGQVLEHKLEMSVKSDFKFMMEDLDFEKYGENIPNSPYTNVPCYRVSGDKLLKCTHLVNGVALNNDIKEIIIAPVEQKFNLTIRIPSRDFFEMIPSKVYRLNSSTIKLLLDCCAYDMTILIHLPKETINKTITFNFAFKKTYNNNNEAIKWIDVVCAFFANEDIIMQEISMQPLNMTKAIMQDTDHHFENYKQYYNDVKQIELLSGVKFKTYNEYTKESHKWVRFVVSYYKRETVSILCDNKTSFDFSTKSMEVGDFIDDVKVKDTLSIVSTDNKKLTYRVNDHDFIIPFRHSIFKFCEVKSIQRDDDGKVCIDFHYPSSTYALLFSNKPVCEEFPELKSLGSIIKND